MWSPAGPLGAGAEPAPGQPTPQDSATTLYLVEPEGARYAITTFPPPGENGQSPELIDWSGDASRALFYMYGPDDGTVIEVDLHSGEQTTFTVPNGFNVTPRYTRPNGEAILLAKTNDVDSPATLTRVDRAGNHQLTYPLAQLGGKGAVEYLVTNDGTQLVLGTDSGLAVMGNDGTPGTALPIPGVADCTPTHWWGREGSTMAVARCYGPDSGYAQLWLVPIDGAAPTALITESSGQGDLGAEKAWDEPSGVFIQALGPCGYKYLATLDNGTITPVSVPNVDEDSSVIVIGANGVGLALQAGPSCGGGRSLLLYDTEAETSTVLLGPPINGGGVVDALTYPGRD
jgi:hypothetical protein